MNFYDQNAASYASQTLGVDMNSLYQPFLEVVSSGGKILDLGCGPGRDLKFFRAKGFEVEGLDSSREMVKIASTTGSLVHHLPIEEMSFNEAFDAIWASASLLHLPRKTFPSVLQKILRALKRPGVLYFSLKEGVGEATSQDGRFFAYYKTAELERLVSSLDGFALRSIWTTEDSVGRNSVQWINVLGTKT